jgi:hypothetical protein
MLKDGVEKKVIGPGIVVYKNLDINYKTIIPEIKMLLDKQVVEWEKSFAVINNEKVVNKTIRDSSSFILKLFTNKIKYDINQTDDDLYNLSIRVSTLINQKIKDYESFLNVPNENIFEDYRVIKYDVDQHFGLHIDDGILHDNLYRRVSSVFYINDDYEGGEINFPNFNISYKPNANDLLVFPSNFMYAHSVSPVIKGTKYCIVGWKK